jgi:hypothetical protein
MRLFALCFGHGVLTVGRLTTSWIQVDRQITGDLQALIASFAAEIR